MTQALVVSLLLVAAPPDPSRPGPYAVGFTFQMIADASRPGDGDVHQARPIPVYIWYPAALADDDAPASYPMDPLYAGVPAEPSATFEAIGAPPTWQDAAPSQDGPFPTVVFSPGWGAVPWMHLPLAGHLASHGFVVAVPYHFGDAWFWWEPFHPLGMAIANRPFDVAKVLDALLARNATAGDLLEGVIRPDQVAAGGWSLGGYASMALAGGDDDVCDTAIGNPDAPEPCSVPGVTVHPDSRFKALLLLDGSNQLLRFQELARVRVPALGMGEEWTMLGGDTWQARQHAAMQGHPSYRVDVAGANHQSFSALCPTLSLMVKWEIWDAEFEAWVYDVICTGITPQQEVDRVVGKYAVAFLKGELAGEQGYQQLLTPGSALRTEPLVELFVTERRNPNAVLEEWPGEFLYFPHQPGSEQARAEKDPKGARRVWHARAGR